MVIIERNIWEIWECIAGNWEDSQVFLWNDENNVIKIYWDYDYERLLAYHGIHDYFAQKWNMLVQTESGELDVSVLALWEVYHDEDYGYYTMPPRIWGNKLIIKGTIASTQDSVLDALWVNHLGTNGLLEYNSKVIWRDGDIQKLKITDLWWKIWRFVEHNKWFL